MKRAKGFTVVEMLAVITIIVLLAGLLVSAVMGGLTGAKIKSTAQSMQNYATALAKIYAYGGGAQTALLKAFNGGSAPSSGTRYVRESYVDTADSAMKDFLTGASDAKGMAKILKEGEEAVDAWGNPLKFRIDRGNADNMPSIQAYSFGADGNDDDGEGPSGLVTVTGDSDKDDIGVRQEL